MIPLVPQRDAKISEYRNQSLAANQAQFGLESISNELISYPVSRYKGLVEPAADFRTPLFVAPQGKKFFGGVLMTFDLCLPSGSVDMLLENDPFRSTPILVDLMHIDQSSGNKYYGDDLVMQPFLPKIAGVALDLQEDFGHANKEELRPIYGDLRASGKLFDERSKVSSRHSARMAAKPREMELNSPVARDMLFYKSSNYYMPFKVNSMGVYGKYLSIVGYGRCSKKDAKNRSKLSLEDVKKAIDYAVDTVDWYENTVTDNAMETKRRTPYIPQGVLDSKVFEYASQYLKKK